MVDQMDGRNMDKSSPDQYNAINMPHLRGLAEKGTQFIGHYTNGPQCVCGRSVLWTGRRTNDIHVYNNAFGLSSTHNGTLDETCIIFYGQTFCENMRHKQSNNFTLLSGMQSIYGDNTYWIGKLHVGGGVLQQPIGVNMTNAVFKSPHDSFNALTRSANILIKYGNESDYSGPITEINNTDPNPHAEDTEFAEKCVERYTYIIIK